MNFRDGLAILAVSVALNVSPAASCQTESALNLDDVRWAAVVIEGSVSKFDVIRDAAARYALINIDVTRTLKGESRSSWKFYWANSSFAFSDSWDYGDPIIIAAFRPQPPNSEYWYGGSHEDRPDLLHVMQQACSEPFILPSTEENKSNLQRAIESQEQADK